MEERWASHHFSGNFQPKRVVMYFNLSESGAATWIVGSSCWAWSERCGDGRIAVTSCSAIISCVAFQALWIKTLRGLFKPYCTLTHHNPSLKAVPSSFTSQNGGFEYTKKQNQTELAGKKPVAPGRCWWTFSIGWKFLIYFQGHFYFKISFPLEMYVWSQGADTEAGSKIPPSCLISIVYHNYSSIHFGLTAFLSNRVLLKY